jgi:hypothetical protein
LDKTIAGPSGVAAALGTISSATAAPRIAPFHVLRANSYADLLEPIDKASEFLRALDAERGASADEGRVQLGQPGPVIEASPSPMGIRSCASATGRAS